MDGGTGSDGATAKPSRDVVAGCGWTVAVAWLSNEGGASPISGARRASVLGGSECVTDSPAGAGSVVRNGSSEFGGDIAHRPSSCRGREFGTGSDTNGTKIAYLSVSNRLECLGSVDAKGPPWSVDSRFGHLCQSLRQGGHRGPVYRIGPPRSIRLD